MTIAVTGATGQLGRLVIAGLKAKIDAGDIVALAAVSLCYCAGVCDASRRVFEQWCWESSEA